MSRRIKVCEPVTRIVRSLVWTGALLLATASCFHKKVEPQAEVTTADAPKVEAKKDVPTAEYCGEQLPIDITEIRGCQNSRDFENLGAFTNLRVLYVRAGSSRLEDISALSKLKKLEVLYLESMPGVDDYSPLAELENLKKLDLTRTRISDLTPLASLTQLEELDLTGCWKVTDISPLANLRNLKRLWLLRTGVENISALGGLSELVRLNLGETKVRDISPVAGLTKLEELDLALSPDVENLSAVGRLANLKRLAIGQTKVKNIKPLAGLKNLEILDMGSLEIKDLTPLLTLKRLSYLEVDAPYSDKVLQSLRTSNENLRID